MKYLAVDLGEKRIGLAISDDKGIIAKPLSIIDRTSDKTSIEEIAAECTEQHIEAIVIGVPYSSKSSVQRRFRVFGEKLSEKTGLSVSEWDETFSTRQAQNMVAFSDSQTGEHIKGKSKLDITKAKNIKVPAEQEVKSPVICM